MLQTIYNCIAYSHVLGFLSFILLCANIVAMYIISLTRNRALCAIVLILLMIMLKNEWFKRNTVNLNSIIMIFTHYVLNFFSYITVIRVFFLFRNIGNGILRRKFFSMI